MKELTREEIDEKLRKLRATISNKESYKCLSPAMAMCYAIRLPDITKKYEVKVKCSGHRCENSVFEVKTIKVDESTLNDILYFYDEETFLGIEYILDSKQERRRLISFEEEKPVKKEENNSDLEKAVKIMEDKNLKERIRKNYSIVDKFRNLGLDVKLKYTCEGCFYKHKPKLEMYIKAKNEEDWHYSTTPLFGAEDCVSISEYEMALNFLKETNKNTYQELYFGRREGSGLIKTKVDQALRKVLGVEIFYTKKEIANDIRSLFKSNNMESRIPVALEVLKLKANSISSDVRKKLYFSYLKENIKISYEDFCKNFYQFYKEELVSKDEYYNVLNLIQNDFLNDNIAEFETIASFEEFFVENQERFIGYIASCGCGYLKMVYESFLKKKAVKLNLKTQMQFFNESLTSDDYLFSFEDYLSFMEGINKVFDCGIDKYGEDRRW